MSEKTRKFLVCALSLVAAFCLFKAGTGLIQETQSAKDRIQILDIYAEKGMDGLKEICPDLAGWIQIPGTDISEPLVKGPDNEWYLEHNATGREDHKGAAFISAMNTHPFAESNTIIYGHSRPEGGMFTNLKKFKDESFFRKHDEVIITDLDGREHTWKIVAYLNETDDQPELYSTVFDDYQTFIDAVREKRYFIRQDIKDWNKSIMLSTCDLDYPKETDTRNIIIAIPEKTDLA